MWNRGKPAVGVCVVALSASLLLGQPPLAGASDPGRLPLSPGLGQVATVAADARVDPGSFIGSEPGRPLPRPDGLPATARPERVAREFLAARGRAFGIGTSTTLELMGERPATAGRSSVRFQQVLDGVPVLGGELIVNLDSRGRILSASGETETSTSFASRPSVSAAAARETARAVVGRQEEMSAAALHASTPKLWVYDSRLMGGPGLGRPTLVWRVEVSGGTAGSVNELVLVDARLGSVALQFSQNAEALNRRICDANNSTAQVPCTTPVRTEGGPASPVADVNLAYRYLGNTYNFFNTRFGRDSFDGAGSAIVATVRACDPDFGACPMRNGFWNREQIVLGAGVPNADDFVGHEMTHAVTQHASGLFYYYQSGAINESLSDVFGEFIDQTNGAGTDTAETRWQIFEDEPGGPGRDMEDPTLFGSPDRMTSPLYAADLDEFDNGGVHDNSGVNNKAAFLITDGGTFNGQTVTGIGLSKAARVYYEAATHLLTSASDYADLHNALQQACANLVGTGGITAASCTQVRKAVTAVEMNLDPPAASVPEARVCPTGTTRTDVFKDDLEDTASGNWVTITGAGLNGWRYPQPDFSTYATSGTHNLWGENLNTTADYSMAMADRFVLPAHAYLRFHHAYGFEDDLFNTYDGGVVEYQVGAGAWTDAGSLFVDNGYTGTVSPDFDNPLRGRAAFVNESNGYYSSRLDLSSLAGRNVRFRFRIGSDQSFGDTGWFVDDVGIYQCADAISPTAQPPTQSLVRFSGLGTNTAGNSIPVRIAWPAGTDDLTPTGNLKYRLSVSVNGGASQLVADWRSSRTIGLTLTPGQSYRFSVETRDEFGNVSPPALGPTFADIVHQEDSPSLLYSSGWGGRLAQANAFGGFVRPTDTTDSTVTLDFSARSVGLIMPARADLGDAEICLLDGARQTCGTRVISGLGAGPRLMMIVFNDLDPSKTYGIRLKDLSGRVELDGVVLLQ